MIGLTQIELLQVYVMMLFLDVLLMKFQELLQQIEMAFIHQEKYVIMLVTVLSVMMLK